MMHQPRLDRVANQNARFPIESREVFQETSIQSELDDEPLLAAQHSQEFAQVEPKLLQGLKARSFRGREHMQVQPFPRP